jgi:hypothetical protein
VVLGMILSFVAKKLVKYIISFKKDTNISRVLFFKKTRDIIVYKKILQKTRAHENKFKNSRKLGSDLEKQEGFLEKIYKLHKIF